MTVGELLDELKNVPHDYEVIVRALDYDTNHYIGTDEAYKVEVDYVERQCNINGKGCY